MKVLKVYYDNTVESGKTRADLGPTEMAALRELEEPPFAGMIEVFTSRETWREQDKTPDPLRQLLLQTRSDIPVVPYDNEILGGSYMPDRYGGFVSSPAITDIIDQRLLDDLTTLGLKRSDAKHLMYAARNGCDRFVTTDRDFLKKKRRQRLEARCQGLRIVAPSELVAELLLSSS